eukprot:scaffold16688_cov38-Phaeocystis_antarctica.AAC.1
MECSLQPYGMQPAALGAIAYGYRPEQQPLVRLSSRACQPEKVRPRSLSEDEPAAAADGTLDSPVRSPLVRGRVEVLRLGLG